MRASDLAAQVKRRLLLSTVVKSAVELKGGGPSYIGLCPFHQEKTPSFHVRDQLGRFKCFGCGESGDVFAFIMRLRGIGFNEAVAELAERTGITNVQTRPVKKSGFQANEEEILRAQAVAQSYFVSQLNSSVLKYLTDERRLDPAMIKQAGIGFGGIDTKDFLTYLRHKRVSESCALAAGISIFKSRITFPIRRRDGKIIAFGGRIFNNSDLHAPKYVNTHAYSAYEKKKNFYGLFESQAAILRGQTPVLVEGYFDAMALWAIGIPALALCGTVLSDEHASMLKRLSAKLILCLDADQAGFKALASSLIKLWQVNISASAVVLDKNDPGDYLASGQLAMLKEKLSTAKDATCLVIDRCAVGLSADIGARIREIDQLLPIFAQMKRPIMRRQYVAYLAHKLHEDPALLWAEINKKTGLTGKKQASRQPIIAETKLSAEEKWLVQIVKADPNLFDKISPNLWQRVSSDFKGRLLLGDYRAYEEDLSLSSPEAQAMLLALEHKLARKQAQLAMGIKRQELQEAEKQRDFSKMFGNLREQSSMLAQHKKPKPIKAPHSKEIVKIEIPSLEEEDWL